MGRKSVLAIAALLLLSTSGCSYLFYPHAKEFTEKAKGATGLDTLINLTNMAETSAQAAKGGTGVDQSFDDLHNQFHAINNSIAPTGVDGILLGLTQPTELRHVLVRQVFMLQAL